MTVFKVGDWLVPCEIRGACGKVVAVEPKGDATLKVQMVDMFAFQFGGGTLDDNLMAGNFMWFAPADVRLLKLDKLSAGAMPQ